MKDKSKAERTLPLLAIGGTVLFPTAVAPLLVGRSESMDSVDAAMATEGKEVVVVLKKEPEKSPTEGRPATHSVGALGIIKRMVRISDTTASVVVQGIERVEILSHQTVKGHWAARFRLFPMPAAKGHELEALRRVVVDQAGRLLSLVQPQVPEEIGVEVFRTDDPIRLVYQIGSLFNLDVLKQQALLEAASSADALELLHDFLSQEIKVQEVRESIVSKVQSQVSKEEKEFLLRRQMRAIQEELGEVSSEEAEASMLRTRLKESSLPPEAKQEAERQVSRLSHLPSASPEYHVIQTYLDLILDLPWTQSTRDSFDIPEARRILNEDHYDLDDVKERILEHLGVMKLNPEAKAPILCFVGPPGVGKTSVGQSIARAMGRKFERMSLGGLHDESELRGHRRTYVGAMPGRIIQAIRRAGVNNPLLMLDEVDKLGRDFRGDPAAALMEILDPEQNRAFRDNYLDLPFDLSRVFFITTANALETIPGPLRDRMETLRLPGYSDEEKFEIARRYLLPRSLKNAGIEPSRLAITDDGLRQILRRYTREAGVRALERMLNRIVRKVGLHFAEGKTEPVQITNSDLPEMLGPEPFFLEPPREHLIPGIAIGLAWTEAGGEILYVEASLIPDGKEILLTGQLGDVMQESAKAARTFVLSHRDELGIPDATLRGSGVHVHVPSGAIPKDGPSAGLTMAVALASVYTNTAVRSDTAMTGEITLTGRVLPVGGIKEKVLAARRSGIRRILLPKDNRNNLREIPEEARREMEVLLIERIEEALQEALMTPIGSKRV